MGVYRRGRIWYIRYLGPDGIVRRESTEQESRRVAEKILSKRKTEIAEGRFLDRVERPTMTFSELCAWYWDHHGKTRRWHGVKGMLERLEGFFGERPLPAITPELVSEYVEQRKENDGVKASTVNKDGQAAFCV